MKLKSQWWIWRSRFTLILVKKFKKNEISKLHEEWKISNSQKMGVLYTHSSKMPGPSPNFLITPK
jgi:hypothetical protein